MFVLGVIWLALLTIGNLYMIKLYIEHLAEEIFIIKKKLYDLQYLKGYQYVRKQEEVEKEIRMLIALSICVSLLISLLVVCFLTVF